MTIEKVKAWLKRYREIMREIENLEERYISLKEKSVSVSSSVLDDMPRSPGTVTDRMAIFAIRLEELSKTISNQSNEAYKISKEIENALNMLSGEGSAEKKGILQMRYLDLCEWCEVSEMLYAKNENFYDGQDSYLRLVFKKHRRALEELAALLPDPETKGE